MTRLTRRDFVAILAAAALAVKVKPGAKRDATDQEAAADPAPPVLPRWIGHC